MDEAPPLDDCSSENRHKPLTRLSQPNQQSPLPESGAFSKTYESLFPFGEISNLDTINEETSRSSSFEQATGNEVSLGEVVQALCSAWQSNRKPKSEVTLDFFTPRELFAMHLAWQKVTQGKHCISEAHVIAESLANAIATAMNPNSPFPSHHLSFISWNLAFHADKNLLAVNLLREWKRITEEDGNFPILGDCDNQSQFERVLRYCQRPAQLCRKICPFILHFRFQLLLHSLLFVWPISMVIVVLKYMDCSVSHSLLYLMTILGSMGCLAAAFRVVLILLTNFAQDPESLSWVWMSLRMFELCFLIAFIIQAYYFFDTSPPMELVTDQCVGQFYSAALKINFVSIALLSVYLLVYTLKIYRHFFHASQ